MDDQQWDQLTRWLSTRASRRTTHALLAGGFAALGMAAEAPAKKKKKKRKKKTGNVTTPPPTTTAPTTAPPSGAVACAGRDACKDSPDGITLPASAICGTRFANGVNGDCYCSTTLTGEPFCGLAPQGLSNDPATNLCMNGGCAAGGGACVQAAGCQYGPIKCAPPCPFPF
ncbi:MAG: hypothetical protein QM692_14360 [Thermomicrobiales bacterium]